MLFRSSLKAVEEQDQEKYLSQFERIKGEYDQIVSRTEIRDDIDFYYTIRGLCNRYNLTLRKGAKKEKTPDFVPKEDLSDELWSEIRGYISENNPCLQVMHVWVRRLWHFLLYIIPILIFILGVVFKGFITVMIHPWCI